jgi:hypothetical protein
MARLLQHYESVLIPFGNGRRYDLVVDAGDRFLRVQCKTGRVRKGCIAFNTASNHYHRGGGTHNYRGEVELFGVYCQDNDKVYMVPVEEVGLRSAFLRLDPAKNNQQSGIRLAEQYELRSDNMPA